MWTRYATVLRRFRRRIGAERFDEVYFAHDIVGRASELALNAYPHATHITFGDALGSLYDKRYHLALASGTGRPPRARQYSRGNRLFPANPLRELGGLARRLVLGAPEQIPAREAVLILPMDQSGACLSGKRLRVVPRELVLQIIQECKRAVPELRRYCTGLIAKTPAPHYLMLLENLADGGFTSFEQEVAMYEEMVRCHVPAGATVFIKAHPSSVAPVDEALRDRLRVDYTPAAVSREFRRYPMELWSDLISACRVVSMSYCSISLAYLYAVPVIYPMESRIIETYIPRRFWESYKDADDLYRGQLANLAGWDGQSVLWAGSLT